MFCCCDSFIIYAHVLVTFMTGHCLVYKCMGLHVHVHVHVYTQQCMVYGNRGSMALCLCVLYGRTAVQQPHSGYDPACLSLVPSQFLAPSLPPSLPPFLPPPSLPLTPLSHPPQILVTQYIHKSLAKQRHSMEKGSRGQSPLARGRRERRSKK